jgi:hypothetical protein
LANPHRRQIDELKAHMKQQLWDLGGDHDRTIPVFAALAETVTDFAIAWIGPEMTIDLFEDMIRQIKELRDARERP